MEAPCYHCAVLVTVGLVEQAPGQGSQGVIMEGHDGHGVMDQIEVALSDDIFDGVDEVKSVLVEGFKRVDAKNLLKNLYRVNGCLEARPVRTVDEGYLDLGLNLSSCVYIFYIFE